MTQRDEGTYLRLLDRDASRFTFQTFAEGKEKGNPKLTRVLHGSLQSHFDALTDLNRRGAGIFVTVNATDLHGRRSENITRIRAIWHDDDTGCAGAFPLPPSVVAATSPGRFQRLWLANGLSREDCQAVMRTMVDTYASD